MITRFLLMVFAFACMGSCSPYRALRKRDFTYTTVSGPQTLQLAVPKRYAKTRQFTDSAGNEQRVYNYGSQTLFYVIQTTDTLTLFQPIDTAQNIPLPHPYGGLMYKGLDSTGRYWREVRTDSFRFGYRFVPASAEHLFDSAVNYAAMRRFLQ